MNKFSACPLVSEEKQVALSPLVQEKVSAEDWEVLTHRAAQVEVTRFVYSSSVQHIVGYMVEPKVSSAEKLPCIVYCRGGTADFGKILQAHLFGILAEMASWGYIVIATQYAGVEGGDGADGFGSDGDVDDVMRLYELLVSYPRADVSRIGLYGGSRGGMMVYRLLTRVNWVRAAVTRAGLSNVFRNERERRGMKEKHDKIFGSGREERIKRSALYWPEKFPKDVPLLLIHGTSDWRVHPLDSVDLSRRLLGLKVPHRLALFEGADHMLSEVTSEYKEMMREWMDRFVKNEGELPDMELHGS